MSCGLCPLSGIALLGRLEKSVKKALRWLVERTPLRSLRDWAIAFSLWPVHLTTSCCGAEFAAAYGPRYDLERFGSLPFVSPRNTNLMIVEGTLTRKMARAARLIWEQMPWPRFVIAMGACAFSGGVFYNSYNIVMVQNILPVDVYIPGCPPRPEALAKALILLQEKVKGGKYRPRDVKRQKVEELMHDLYEDLRRFLPHEAE